MCLTFLLKKGALNTCPIDMQDAGAVQTQFGGDTFAVIEKWESLDHLKAHMVAPHMAAYANQVKDMLVDRVIHVSTPV